MNRALKILLWTVGSIVGLVILGIVAIYIFFPLDKAKAMAIEKGSAAIGRPINIGNVGLSLWGGIGVKLENVSIGNPAGMSGDPVLQTSNVDVKLRFSGRRE